MNRLLMVRVLVTLPVLLLWAASILRGSIGVFPFSDDRVADSTILSIKTDDVFLLPLPPGVMEGDRFDEREFSVADRLMLYAGPPAAGSRRQFKLHRGDSTRLVSVVAVPQPIRSVYVLQTVISGIYTLLGLILLWRGRDWVAWGLALFSLSYGLKELPWMVALHGAGWVGELLSNVVLRPARDVGLYLASRHLSGSALPRRVARISQYAIGAVVTAVALIWLYDFVAWNFQGKTVTPFHVASRVLVQAATCICLLTLAIGYRHAGDADRLRIRWVLVATMLLLSTWIVWPLNEPNLVKELVAATLAALAMTGFAYAVLRHRLVDLHFVISRTLVYGTVVALVVGTLAIVEHAIAAQAMGKETGSHCTCSCRWCWA